MNYTNPKNSKEMIVAVLSKDWPLSAKQIYEKCKREFACESTYQAIHKSIKQLEEERIIEKNSKGYLISKEWIEKNKQTAEQLFKTYSNNRKDGEPVIVNSLHEADMFILDYVVDNLPLKKTEMGWLWSHYWIPLFFSMKEYQKLTLAAEKMEVYSVVRGNTPIDKWCAEFWGKSGAHTLAGTDYGNWPDTIAFGDNVLQAYYPKEILKELKDIFNKAKKFEDLDIKELFEKLFNKKTKIPITTTKNPALAKQIIQEAKKYFE